MRPIALLLILTATCFAADEPLPLQKPSLSKTHIVFVYAGDLWSVPRAGGDAVRLTSGIGGETDPAFSPDGAQIAFTGEYDGNVDVFVMPASGGVPKRLTWHPSADYVLGWTADGKRILFSSPRTAYSRFNEMFSVPAEGGVVEKLPLPTGYEASVSPDGQSIAYGPIQRAFAMWKNYRGGSTTRIWIARLSDSSIAKVPRTNSNDFNPMWAGDRVYFLSDRSGPVTLFYYGIKSKAVREAIPNQGLDLKSAALGPDAIVYEQFGGIYLYDLKTGKTAPVPIRVQGDLSELRARFVNVAGRLGNGAVSPNGARAVFAPRGEIITVPAEKGDPRNLTNTPGVNVQAGEYLLAVNGREVRAPDNVYRFFEGLAGKSVVLKVGSDPNGAGAREVTVVPVADEYGLRNLAWIEENRRKVDKLTGGQVAYVYMPDTGTGGLAAFNRYFYAQVDKKAMIIDERFNGGGMLATDITEILNRKPLSAAANRTGADPVQPQGIFGPKVMIINESAGSGGDAMPWYFKRSGAGKLVGTRTWGGLVGMASAPPLMDGGIVTAPASGIYNPLSGEWEVENIGIAPDIEVEQDPALVRKGEDPQLEKAIAVVLDELKKNPPTQLRRPGFPNYHR